MDGNNKLIVGQASTGKSTLSKWIKEMVENSKFIGVHSASHDDPNYDKN